MKPSEIIAFELYAKLKPYHSKISRSKEIIKTALSKHPEWYIAFSGGKDSTCVLSLIRSIDYAIPAVSSIQEWCLPETKQYLDRIENLQLVASGSDHNTGWSPNWEKAADIPANVKWLGEKGNVIKNYGRDERGVFLGLRQDESRARKIHLRKQGPLFFNNGNQVWQCNPIAHWSVMDVWAYIFSNHLDYNRGYDIMSDMGISLECQRIGPLAIETALGYGQLQIIKQGWPELFNRYAERHTEARSYV